MARAAVVGADMTKFGVHDKPLQELFGEAALPALAALILLVGVFRETGEFLPSVHL